MPRAAIAGAELCYELIDLTPPWLAQPETVVFDHGVGASHARRHVIGRAPQGLPLSHARICAGLPRGFLDKRPEERPA